MGSFGSNNFGTQNVALNGNGLRVYNYNQESAGQGAALDGTGRYIPVNTYASQEGAYPSGQSNLQPARNQLKIYGGDPIGSIAISDYSKYTPVNVYSGAPRSFRM